MEQLLAVALVAPFAISCWVGIGAELATVAFTPYVVLCSAALLYLGRRREYLSLCTALFLFAPFIRRMSDYQLGPSELPLIMIAPYAALVTSSGSVLMLMLSGRSRAGTAPLIVLILICAYGLLVAILHGRAQWGFFEFIRWAAPLLFCVWLANQGNGSARLIASFGRAASLFAPLVAIYGILQFVSPPPWDAYWMLLANMDSIGRPEPFEVRVFATMNSPGSLGAAMVICIPMLLVKASWVGVVATLVALTAVALSAVRSAWMALSVALLFLAVLGTGRMRRAVATAAIVAVVVTPMVLAVPGIGEYVSDRASSLMDPAGDVSYNARIAVYQDLGGRIAGNLFGRGLALSNGSGGATDETGGQIDSGLIEVVWTFGALAGTCYLAVFCATVLRVVRRASGPDAPFAPGLRVGVIGMLVMLLFGPIVSGESGFFLWTAVGLLMGSGSTRVPVTERIALSASRT